MKIKPSEAVKAAEQINLLSLRMNLGRKKLSFKPLYTPNSGIPLVPTTSCPA